MVRLLDRCEKGIHIDMHDDPPFAVVGLAFAASVVGAEFPFRVHRLPLLHPDFVERPRCIALIIGKLEEIGGVIEHGKIAYFALPDIGFPGAGYLFDLDRPAIPAEPYRFHAAVFEHGDHIYGFFDILVHGDVLWLCRAGECDSPLRGC